MSARDTTGGHRDPVSIIIPAHNQADYCRRCLDSLRAHTAPPYRLILVDNGSTDGAGELFDDTPAAEVIHAGANLGFAGGVNLGLERASGHVVLLNSDTILSPGWLERLTRALESERDVGLAGPVSNCAAGPQQIDTPPLENEPAIHAFAAARAGMCAGTVREVTRLIGFCLMIREEAWRKAGRFDERFAIGNFEDDDYCTRVRRAGYRLVVAEDCFVFHFGGRTFEGMGLTGAAYDALLEQNRRRYEEKWAQRLPRGPDARRRAQALAAQARAALNQHDSAGALRLFRAAVEADPAQPAIYRELAALLSTLGEEAMAQRLLAQAARLETR